MPEPLAYGPHARAMLDGVVLRMVKSDDREAAAQMCELCRRFAAAQSEDVAARSFWKIAAALMLRLAVSSLPTSTSSAWPRACSCSTPAWPYDSLPPARLLQDLMFFARRPGPASRPARA